MPTVYKPKRKTSNPSERKRLRQKYYQKSEYRAARDIYLQSHIWCNRCLQEGKHIPGEELHHIKSPFDGGLTDSERYSRLMDEDNWELLCKDCHIKHHRDEIEENQRKKAEWKRNQRIY